MRLAWTPEFFETIKATVPEYEGVTYEQAFYDWKNAFEATWPSLMEEPESELVKVEKVKFEALTAALEVLLPQADPQNKARLVEFFANNLNESKRLFSNPLVLDYDELANYEPPQPVAEPSAPSPHNI